MKKLFKYGLLLTVAAGVMACQKESDFGDGSGVKDLGDKIEISLEAGLSVISVPETRAISEADESAVTRLDVLVFSEADSKFAYAATATETVVSGGKLAFKVALRKSTASETYRIVLLANLADDAVSSAVSSGKIVAGTTLKAAALNALTFTPEKNWTSGAYIPMWGEMSSPAKISTSTTPADLGTASMIRALARVNVTNTTTSNFTLEAVAVYNSANFAYAAPLAVNYDGANKKVTAPSVPSGVGKVNIPAKTVIGTSLSNEIYIGESLKKNVGDADAVCVILKGKYKGSSVSTYYRIDMIKSGTETLDILRNHTYNINIIKVGGAGFSTEDEAFKSLPVNITADIQIWNDANMGDITSDGQYTIAVESSNIQLSHLTGSSTFNYTVTPSGTPVTVTATSTDDWLTLTAGQTSTPVKFSYTANTGSVARTAVITLAVGRIRKEIKVTQLAEPVIADYTSKSLSNCYILNSHPTKPTVYKIPVERVNDFWGNSIYPSAAAVTENRINTNDKWIVGLIWQDTQYMVTPIGGIPASNMAEGITITKASGRGHVDYFEITVPAGYNQTATGKGNFSVAITKGSVAPVTNGTTPGKTIGEGAILWSWHFWVTDYNPYETMVAETPEKFVYPLNSGTGELHRLQDATGTTLWGTGGEYESKFMLDRNIGINSSFTSMPTFSQAITGSLYYQYGRKDPFPANDVLYDINCIPVIYSTYANNVNSVRTMSYAVNNPMQFFSHGLGELVGVDYMWNDPDVPVSGVPSGKSIFDPSPQGFKLPNKDTWSDFTSETFPVSGVQNSFMRTYKNRIVYPTTATRAASSTGAVNLWDDAYYWTASPFDAGNGYRLQFTDKTIIPLATNTRTSAFTIRSIQE